MRSIAVLLYGESFRTGQQCSRIIGRADAYDAQKAASDTHVAFLAHLTSTPKHAHSCDVFVSSVTTQFDADLVSFYGPMLKTSAFVEQSASYDGFHFLRGNELIVQSGKMDEYDRILYIRIDLHLKPQLFDAWDAWDAPDAHEKISFASICFLPFHKVGNSPRVNPVIAVIPKKYYRLITEKRISLTHDTWHELVAGGLATDSDFDVILDTYHDSDSYKDWNPIYYMCSRAETPTWHSKGWAINRVTLEPDASAIEYLQG